MLDPGHSLGFFESKNLLEHKPKRTHHIKAYHGFCSIKRLKVLSLDLMLHIGLVDYPLPHPQHFYQIPFIIGQYLFKLWGGGRYFSCTYVSAQKTNWMQTFQLRVRRLNRKNTHCLESQAECSKAKSGQPTFSLNKSTCFLNCDMASNGADAWKLRRQICETINKNWLILFGCQDNSKVCNICCRRDINYQI